MKILTVVGARPQFIKAAPVSRALKEFGHTEIMIHTGQHYDALMSDVFFKDLDIPEPAVNLRVGSASHAKQTGTMMVELEEHMLHHKPDWVLVYGDTNSTLAAALAASKIHIPVAHVEAGLRSHNRLMPEEINRVLTDHASTLLFPPTETAQANLMYEGIRGAIVRSGDVMVDSLYSIMHTHWKEDFVSPFPDDYLLLTLHRAESTGNPQKLKIVLDAFKASPCKVLFPVHPRTLKTLGEANIVPEGQILMLHPKSYLDMMRFLKFAKAVFTDSGGLQKEAAMLNTPCYTLREETEWKETVEEGANVLLGMEPKFIEITLRNKKWLGPKKVFPTHKHYGRGEAARVIAESFY